jgi:hypothetical protein
MENNWYTETILLPFNISSGACRLSATSSQTPTVNSSCRYGRALRARCRRINLQRQGNFFHQSASVGSSMSLQPRTLLPTSTSDLATTPQSELGRGIWGFIGGRYIDVLISITVSFLFCNLVEIVYLLDQQNTSPFLFTIRQEWPQTVRMALRQDEHSDMAYMHRL